MNGCPSRFFKASRGLRQGCLLSPFIFLIIAEALIQMLKETKEIGVLGGLRVTKREMVSHLLFVDDILCCIQGMHRDLSTLKYF
jgi:hypothetical protein